MIWVMPLTIIGTAAILTITTFLHKATIIRLLSIILRKSIPILRLNAAFHITPVIVLMIILIGMIPAANWRIKKKIAKNSARPGDQTTARRMACITNGHAMIPDAQLEVVMQILTLMKINWQAVLKAAQGAPVFHALLIIIIHVMITM